jgi:hypothetical protein
MDSETVRSGPRTVSATTLAVVTGDVDPGEALWVVVVEPAVVCAGSVLVVAEPAPPEAALELVGPTVPLCPARKGAVVRIV